MNGPVEVLLVSERLRFLPALLQAWLLTTVSSLSGGAFLMWLLPLLTSTFGLHVGERGYLRCVLLVGLTRLICGMTFGKTRPMASSVGKS